MNVVGGAFAIEQEAQMVARIIHEGCPFGDVGYQITFLLLLQELSASDLVNVHLHANLGQLCLNQYRIIFPVIKA
ncbi:hypothetical protein D1872_303010 [compost metagenome]